MLTVEEMDRAIRLATEHLVEEYRQNLIIEAAQFPDEAPPGYDPEGWALFAILDRSGVGEMKYVAVHLETGKTKSVETWGA